MWAVPAHDLGSLTKEKKQRTDEHRPSPLCFLTGYNVTTCVTLLLPTFSAMVDSIIKLWEPNIPFLLRVSLVRHSVRAMRKVINRWILSWLTSLHQESCFCSLPEVIIKAIAAELRSCAVPLAKIIVRFLVHVGNSRWQGKIFLLKFIRSPSLANVFLHILRSSTCSFYC